MWLDTHCHLDAPAFGPGHEGAMAARAVATRCGVGGCVMVAVQRSNFQTVRALAHRTHDAYALGIHPWHVPQAADEDLDALDELLSAYRHDAHLVAVGEIGLDFLLPSLVGQTRASSLERQIHFYRAQLRLARKHGLPVLLHARGSVDVVLKHLRQLPTGGGVAHAFSGSAQQAQAFIDQGLGLGFGAAMTFEAAQRLRHLARTLPINAVVLESDAPYMLPSWLYVRRAQRMSGQQAGLPSPADVPRMGTVMADLRGMPTDQLACHTTANAARILPRLQGLMLHWRSRLQAASAGAGIAPSAPAI